MLKCNSPDHTSPMSVFDFADRNPVPVWEGQFSGGRLNDPLDKNEDSILFTYSRRSSITVNSQTTVDPSQTLIEGKLISNANSGDESPTCLSRTRPPRRPRQDDSSVEIIFQDEPLGKVLTSLELVIPLTLKNRKNHKIQLVIIASIVMLLVLCCLYQYTLSVVIYLI